MTREKYLKLAKTHHLIPLFVYAPWASAMILAALIWGGVSVTTALLGIASGIFSWTLIEYFLHRFPYHLQTEKEPWRFLTSGFHLLHHEIPNSREYIVAPILMTMATFLVILGLASLVTQSLSLAGLWGSGVAIGYLVYEWIHFEAHHGKPRTAIGRYLKQYHMIHHFADSDNYFGVSSPIWDMAFGTKPRYDPNNKDTRILPIVTRAK